MPGSSDAVRMTLTLIAAMDAGGAIGKPQGGLPWHLPDEAAEFRAYCAGKWLLVGRRTYEEMLGWFQPDHCVVVLTRRPQPSTKPTCDRGGAPASLVTTPTLPEALRHARGAGADELVVLGGAETFAAALPLAGRLVLSRLDLRTLGTVKFPSVDWSQWHLHRPGTKHRDSATGVEFCIEHWDRCPPPMG